MGKNRILKYIFAYNTEIKETMATLAYLIGNSKYTYLTQLGSTVDVFPLLDGYEAIPAPTAEYMTALSDFWHLLIYLKSGPYSNQNTIAQSWSLANGS